MRIERTFNRHVVKFVATHNDVWRNVTDDQGPSKSAYEPLMDDRVVYLLVKLDDERVGGMFMFMPVNGVTAEVHTTLLKPCRGRLALEAARLAREWMWNNTKFLRITTTVPEYNKAALLFSKWTGMKEYGMNPESIVKDGVLQGQRLLGVSKCR